MILTGAVMHRRLFPVQYRFVYRLFSLLLDLDELPQLHRRLRLFSHNRFNLFSFYDRDHGSGEDVPLRRWIEAVMADHGIELAGGRIELLSFPRVLGHVFNPISIWYCRHRDGSLRAVICEVNNTFGERHHYLLHEQGRPLEWPLRAEKAKVFHVSPFLGMQARYRFRLSGREDRLAVLIREYEGPDLMLVASLSGHLVSITDGRLAWAFVRYPFLTLKVVAMIHWQALKLWIQRVPFYPKPPAPQQEVS